MSVVKPRFEPGFPFAAHNLWTGANFVVQRLLPKVWDFELVGRNAITRGPMVLAVNHFSHIDPVAAAIAAERPVRFLGLDQLFGRSKVFDGVTYYLGVIPMPRGRVPLKAMRAALDHLDEGGAVGLFPEGRRVSEWGESPPTQGAAWLALRAGCPLVPMAIWGSDQAMGVDEARINRHPIRVAIGDPMMPERYANRASMTEAWWQWMGSALTMLGSR